LMALAVRLPMLLLAHGADFDMESYARVAKLLSEGGKLYGDPSLAMRYPYLPAWGLLLWALDALSRSLGLNASWIFKLPALAGDLGVTALIYMMANRLSSSPQTAAIPQESFWSGRAFWAAAAWAVNPLSILISAGHGQFDSVALGFVLLAAWYLEFSEHPRSDFASALSLGFAIAFKTWPLFFLPLFLASLSSKKERLAYGGICLLLPLLLLLPFLLSCGWEPTLQALSYGGSQALSLPEALRSFFFVSGASPATYRQAQQALSAINVSALLLAWLCYLWGPWKFPIFAGLAFATLTLYVFAPGLAAQYLCWLLPFALLVPGRLALRHGMLASFALVLFYGFFAPEAFLKGGEAYALQKPAWFFIVWGFMNLALWLFFVREWFDLGALCLRPSGRLNFL
jgi:hypothetical protein